jgi:hypothetical protein
MAGGLDLEVAMPYAVFEDGERLTRVFATEQEAWAAAESEGLVETAPDGKKVLDDHLEIRPCNAEPQEDDCGSDFILS